MTRREDYLGYRVTEGSYYYRKNLDTNKFELVESNTSAYTELDKFEYNVQTIFIQAQELLLKKHEAYGPTNISRAPGGPENGLRVRMHDKMARLNHILENPSVDTNDESLEDTLKDLLNYCAIFIMVRRGQWPDVDNSGPDCD